MPVGPSTAPSDSAPINLWLPGLWGASKTVSALPPIRTLMALFEDMGSPASFLHSTLGAVLLLGLFAVFFVAPLLTWIEERRQFKRMSFVRTMLVVQTWIFFTTLEAIHLSFLKAVFGVDVRQRAHDSCQRIAMLIMRTYFAGYEVRGKEHLQGTINQPVIFIANHQSMLDVAAMFSLGVKAAWVAKTTVFWIPGVGWLMSLAGYVSVSRKNKTSIKRMYASCKDCVYAGWSLILFPQGTRNRRRTLPFKDGAFNLAAELGIPVTPVTIHVPEDVWHKGTKIITTVHPPILDTQDKEAVKAESFKTILSNLATQPGKVEGAVSR